MSEEIKVTTEEKEISHVKAKNNRILNFFRNIKTNIKLGHEYTKLAKENEIEYHKPAEDDAISIQNITKLFISVTNVPFRALDNVSFTIKKGEFHGFIGNNGAGKTTTIRMILNYYRDGFGKIFINGINSKDKKAKEKIGYVPEISVFPKNLTIFEYLYYFARLSKMPKKDAIEKVKFLMQKYGFDEKIFNKSAEKLSSGQKKMILLIQALINDPDILIMDEPAANLDPSARIRFYEAVSEIHKQGKTILMSSHILSELERYIDSFTVLENGHVKDTGRVSDKLKNRKYNYKINSTNNQILYDFCKQNKITCLLSDDSLLLKIDSMKAKTKIFDFALENKVDITSFKENKISLNQIYFNTPNGE